MNPVVHAHRPLDHDDAMHIAAVEYDRLLDVVDSLQPDDYDRPTECVGWNVRAILGHVLGMLELNADPAEQHRQRVAAGEIAARSGGPWIDALTGLQVREHAHLSRADLTEALHRSAPAALAARRAATPEQRAQSVPAVMSGETDWTLGYLLDVIHTRDPWMHRVDISRATGARLALTAEHDGRIVADVVGDWAGRHAQPYRLVLTGPAGGTFRAGENAPERRMDAVEFCRILSGRAYADGLLTTAVPF